MDNEFADLPLDDFEASLPPSDFADKVLAEHFSATEVVAAKPRDSKRFIYAIAAGLLFAVLGWNDLPTLPSSGELVASVKTEAEIGNRGVVVAEKGTELNWQVAFGGDAEITQENGRALYRVERGGDFIVHTHAGDIIVQGTVFIVEVEKTSTLVTTLEGKVLATTNNESVEVAAGETAKLEENQIPIKVTEPDQLKSLMEAKRSLEQRTELLEKQLKTLMIAKANGTDPLVAENRRLETEIAEVSNELELEKRIRAELEGEKIPFPEDLPHEFTQEGQLEAYTQILSKTGYPGEIEVVDCTEYPCIVCGDLEIGEAGEESRIKAARTFQDVWKTHFDSEKKDVSMYWYTGGSEEGKQNLFNFCGIAHPRPKDKVLRKAIDKRLHNRYNDYREAQ